MGEARRREQFVMKNGALPPGTQVQVDLTKAERKACACGCQYFTQAVAAYTVSALLSPTGRELPVQVPVLICLECKTPLGTGIEKH